MSLSLIKNYNQLNDLIQLMKKYELDCNKGPFAVQIMNLISVKAKQVNNHAYSTRSTTPVSYKKVIIPSHYNERELKKARDENELRFIRFYDQIMNS